MEGRFDTNVDSAGKGLHEDAEPNFESSQIAARPTEAETISAGISTIGTPLPQPDRIRAAWNSVRQPGNCPRRVFDLHNSKRHDAERIRQIGGLFRNCIGGNCNFGSANARIRTALVRLGDDRSLSLLLGDQHDVLGADQKS